MGVDFLPHAVGESIRGIDEDEVETLGSALLVALGQPAAGVGADELRALAEAEALDVAERRAGVAVDEDRPAAPRESASIASAPVPQKRSRTRAPADLVAERREDRLADAVGGRPHPPAAGRDQGPPLELSGDDPH